MAELRKQAVWVDYFRINRDINFGKYKYAKGDLIVVKEREELPDGGYRTRIRMKENYERPFWITLPKYRTHKDKREWESLDKVKEYRCPHHELSLHVQKALGRYNPDPAMQLRVVCRSPYVYGTDSTPSYFVKEAYSNKYNGWIAGPTTVARLDIETDVLGIEENRIILLSMVFGNHGEVHALKEFISRTTNDYENQFFSILDTDIPQVRGELGFTVSLHVHDDEISLLKAVFKQLHQWKPDYVSGWNVMMFDQDVIAKRLVELGEDPALYFSDPSIPERYKQYKFVEGKKFAVSDSGKKTVLRPIQRWHQVIAPASFRWIDAMCCYYQFRKHEGMLPSYKLDYVLKRHIKMGKYEIPEAESKKGLSRHLFMQRYYPVHYAVYSLMDSIGLELLDREIGDINGKFNNLLGDSDYRSHQSNPSKLVDGFTTYLRRKRGMVLAGTSDQMFNEWDAKLPPLSGWIVALPTVMLDETTGLSVIKELPKLKAKVHTHGADDDLVSSYPLCGVFDNISRQTTEIEVLSIRGKTHEDRALFGLNLMAGRVNSLSNARLIFDLPHLHEWDELWEKLNDEYSSK